MFRLILAGIATAAVGTFIGCGSGQPPAPPDENRATLEEVYSLLKIPREQGKAPARRVEELRQYENAYPTGYAAVQTGQIVVNWGADPTVGSDAVLAFQKDVPATGGFVLLQSGAVKQMTADEFKAAPKAK